MLRLCASARLFGGARMGNPTPLVDFAPGMGPGVLPRVRPAATGRAFSFPGAPMCEKKTQKVGIWVTEQMELDLHRLAAAADLSVSAYLERVLRRHCYGHSRTVLETTEGPDRPDSGR